MSLTMHISSSPTSRAVRLGWCLLFSASLAGCSFFGAKTAKPKPAPDVFLHAATVMKADPANCPRQSVSVGKA